MAGDMNFRGIIASVSLGLAIVSTHACSRDDGTAAPESVRPPPLTTGEHTPTVDRFRGSVGAPNDGDDGFPFVLPVHPGAQLIASMEQQGAGHVRMYRSADPPEVVEAFYRERLGRDGWEAEFDGEADGMPMLGLSRGEDRMRISIEGGSGGTIIRVAAAATD
jgi:hypothetical protein